MLLRTSVGHAVVESDAVKPVLIESSAVESVAVEPSVNPTV